MKRYCKNIDITNRELIQNAVYKCLDGKYGRSDVTRMLSEYSGLSINVIDSIFNEFGKESLYPIVETVIDGIRQELLYKNISIIPIWYNEKIDQSSGKIGELEYRT